MAEKTRPHGEEVTISALVKNTEAVTNLNVTLTAFQRDYVEGKRLAREASMSINAKLDNLDRTVGEMRLALEQSQAARIPEMDRLFALLGEERRDRKDIQSTAGKDERQIIQDFIRDEMEHRKTNQSMLVKGIQAIWHVGGKYIVIALAILVVAAVMKMTGLSLAEIIGLARK